MCLRFAWIEECNGYRERRPDRTEGTGARRTATFRDRGTTEWQTNDTHRGREVRRPPEVDCP